MPRFSLTSHCQVCGREITQAGSARKWIHIDQFYGRADHDPVPRENSKYLLPKPAAAHKAAAPLSDAERRRRLRGEAPVETTGEAAAKTLRRPRAEAAEAHDPDIDEAARRLRRLRLGLDPDGHD